MKKEKLSRNAIIILADLYRAKRPLPIKQIAQRNNISWKTANNHIETLKKRGMVDCKKTKRRNYCTVSGATMIEIGE